MIRLSKVEEEIMTILWRIEKGFPKEILTYMKDEMPYNTFLSTISKLEKEGFVDYTKFGRSHQYFPIVTKKAYSKSLYKNMMRNLFGNSKEQLLSFFMEEEKVDYDEIQELLKNFKNKNE